MAEEDRGEHVRPHGDEDGDEHGGEHLDDLHDDVQASGSSTERLNRRLQRSTSEQARYLSAYFGWTLDGDRIRSQGTTVAMFVEDLADTMVALGWLGGSGVVWAEVPVDADDAVARVRRHQVEQGWMTPGTR